MFEGKTVQVRRLEAGLAEMTFGRDAPINKFDAPAVREFGHALDALERADAVQGLLVTSGNATFLAGADVTEFLPAMLEGREAVERLVEGNAGHFRRLEDLPFPVVAAVNGVALGGGFEFCLACDYRVASTQAVVGLPETRFGIIPGWGGTVRLPRIAGVDVALEWIGGGKQYGPEAALKVGALDAVVAPEHLREAALRVLREAVEGKLDFRARREAKASPLPLNAVEAGLAFGAAKGFVAGQAGPHYPAPLAAVETLERAWSKGRDEAHAIEKERLLAVATGTAAVALVGIFVNDQFVERKARTWEKAAPKGVQRAAVLGAGIMGGGIAYQSSLRGVPIRMKDVVRSGLDLGLAEAGKLLAAQVERGRMSPGKMAEVLGRIEPTLSYEGFGAADIVVEAVVEKLDVKRAVLAEVEHHVAEDAVIASNTSTLSIDLLAGALRRPERFCGMHFFNPVHQMKLVEVVRGSKTSDQAVARTVAYAGALGKKAVVVRDCPGFLVNRVLFPYFSGFSGLVRDGADFQKIDKAMERWGWPMGPAYLLDVVGIDTAAHAAGVMADGFPERMGKTFTSAIDVMFQSSRYGQKNGKGFYAYEPDRKGRIKKVAAGETYELLRPHVAAPRDFPEQEIVARLMVPMATELARCLEEGIVDSVAEADTALVYGLGFPPFRGGVFRWIDSVGARAFCALADEYAGLGPLYEPPASLRGLAAAGESCYGPGGRPAAGEEMER